MKAILKFWTVLLCAGLVIGSCCDDPIAPENPDTGDDDNSPVEQPEKPLTDGSLFTVQLNDDIMATVGTNAWGNIAYGNGKYIATGSPYSSNNFAISNDGQNWELSYSIYPSIKSGSYRCNNANFLNEHYIIVGSGYYTLFSGTGTWTSPTVFSSLDCEEWQSIRLVSFAEGGECPSIIYVNGNYIAISKMYRGSSYVSRSSDLISWTNSEELSAELNDIIYANDIYVAIGKEKGSSNDGGVILWSTDCIAWTKLQKGSSEWLRIAYGNGRFVGVDNNGSVVYSTNGTNWTIQPVDFQFKYITFGKGVFIAVSSNAIYLSSDGIEWNEVYSSPTQELNCAYLLQ